MALPIVLALGWSLAGAAQLGPAADLADSQPAASAPAASLQLATCQQLLLAEDFVAARDCYRRLTEAAHDPDRIRLAAALAALAQDMSPDATPLAVSAPAPSESNAAVDFVVAGKAELVLASGLYGLWIGGLAAATAAMTASSFGFGSGAATLVLTGVLLLPVVGGATGLAAAGVATALLPELSAGDANLIRSAMFAGALNSITAMILLGGLGVQFSDYDYDNRPRIEPRQAPLLMIGVSALPVLAAVGAAAAVDLPDGGVALATSIGIWGSVVALLGMGALQPSTGGWSSEQWSLAIGLLGIGADALALSTLIASPILPVSRPETWALDLGALLGLGVGAALAFGLQAPNPLIGFGTMAGGTLLGGAAGFTAAFMGRRLLEGFTCPGLPQLVAVAPLIAPGDPRRGGDPLVGMTLGFSF